MKNEESIIINISKELMKLIPGFLDKKRTEIEYIVECLEKCDFNAIEDIAHKIKGSGGSYEFDVISEIAFEIEKAAKIKDKDKIRSWISEFSDFLSRVKVIYV